MTFFVSFVPLDAAGTWSPWQPVTVTWREDHAHVARVDFDEPAVAVELHPGRAALTALTLGFRHHPVSDATPLARELPFERAAPKSALPSWVVRRAAWGARNTGLCGSAHTPRFLTVHHTATPNSDSLTPAARMRQMQAYHIDVLRWCDFGYHFTVGIDGRVYEGRASFRRTGSHVGDHNTGNLGVSVVGNFVSFTPRQVQLDGLVQIVSWLVGQTGIPTTTTGIRGHRDWPGHRSNACPGDRLYAWLPTLRSAVQSGGNVPPTCTDACTPGTTRCHGDGVQTCVAGTGGGCATWGPTTSCGCGAACAAGVCVRDPDVCCPAVIEGAGDPFADVPATGWLADVVAVLVAEGITAGCATSPPMFCPDCRVTRAQAATFLARALALDLERPLATATYADVPLGHPYFAAVEAATQAGLFVGCASDPRRFCPDDLLSRAAAATVLANAADIELATAVTPIFADVPAGHWARAAIESLHRRCHVDGCSAEPLSFCPDRNVSRAEFGLVLVRVLDLAPELEVPCCRPQSRDDGDATFDDLPADSEVAAAANALFDAGITAGCSVTPRFFCGECRLSRGQAAALLARAARLSPLVPDVPSFVDVPPTHPFFSEIETLFAAGIAYGCSAQPRAFCPDADVTRAQVAILLARALRLPFEAVAVAPFADVAADAPGAPALAGLRAGCIAEPCDRARDHFCPDSPMTRGDLAYHLARAFSIGTFGHCLPSEESEWGPDAGGGDPWSPDAGGGDPWSPDAGGGDPWSPDAGGGDLGADVGLAEDASGAPDVSGEPGAADASWVPSRDTSALGPGEDRRGSAGGEAEVGAGAREGGSGGTFPVGEEPGDGTARAPASGGCGVGGPGASTRWDGWIALMVLAALRVRRRYRRSD
jgi:MYXO-CTERM domain-containing protein